MAWVHLYYIIIIFSCSCTHTNTICYDSSSCSGNGVCKNDATCACYDGWQGSQCQFCGGKVRLGAQSGIIHDGFGDYSIGSKCSWLINTPNSSITLHIEEFVTECGWDHLYVFDGDSVNSPLLAVFSGLMYKNSYSIRKIPEVVAHSGSALLHFSSDDALSMSGFNISYRLNACPSKTSGVDCSGNGVCVDGVCLCDGKWDGIACHLLKCPNDCWRNESRGWCEPEKGCICNEKWKGEDCGQLASHGYWETVNPQGYTPSGSASHGAAVWRESMYVVAGENYNGGPVLNVYDFKGNVWESPKLIQGTVSLTHRYGHSTVLYEDKLFVYGGVVGNKGPTSELWAFDISAKTWENITVKAGSCNDRFLLCGPLKSAGHSSTVVTNLNNKKADKMVVIFGHSPSLGYLNTVQEYYFGTREWHIVSTRGYPVKGGYGHTASWDKLTRKIYVYGGIVSKSESTQLLSRHLYSYDVETRIWTFMTNAPTARFLHTSTFISPGLMLVFGGNTHNDTSHSFGAKCYSSEVLTYDVECDSWDTLDVTAELQADLARFGHSAVIFGTGLYIYGGFDGQMLSDMLKYTPGSCLHLTSSTACLNARVGVKCVWDRKNNKCVHIQDISQTLLSNGMISKCSEDTRSFTAQGKTQKKGKCKKYNNCASCVQRTNKCIWFERGVCTRKKYRKNLPEREITSLDQCPIDPAPTCKQLHTCTACSSQLSCRWKYKNAKCTTVPSLINTKIESTETINCPKVCAEYTSCLNCTQEKCIWCQNEGRCIDPNAYSISFPYGQCREFTTVSTKCKSKGERNAQCSFYSTCLQCREDPACGWCNDGSTRGLGKCMPGGYAGPTHAMSLSSNKCPSEKWHFTTCPSCQCNGHASCHSNTGMCQPCHNFTMGPHCETCVPGYWGNPANGGKCQPCECNGQATQCHSGSGKCYCTTKGLVGDHCDRCDRFNRYYGDPINKESCYYDLITDYQFTFKLSKNEDRHYTQINFQNSPIKPDIDVDFQVTCSVMAKVNITVRSGSSKEEKLIYTNHNCTTFKSRFSKSEYSFGIEDVEPLTTFHVYIYDFQTPLWIQISFSQHPKLNLKQLFVTFSTFLLSSSRVFLNLLG